MLTIADDTAPAVAVPVAVQTPSILRRGVALAIDMYVLGFACAFIAFFGEARLQSLGRGAAWIGAGIGVLYFGIGASSITSGRTLGKLITGIAVRRLDGGLLSLRAGLLRAAIVVLGISGILGAYSLANILRSPWLIVPAMPLTVIPLAIPYLALADAPTSRTVQDYATGSIVVRVPLIASPVAPAPFRWRQHLPVLAAMLGIPAELLLGQSLRLWRLPVGSSAALGQIAALAHTPDVAMSQELTWSLSTGKRTDSLQATATIYAPPSDPDALARGMAAAVLRNVPDARNRAAVVVEITTRFDMLFRHDEHTTTWKHTPAEWAEIVANPEKGSHDDHRG